MRNKIGYSQFLPVLEFLLDPFDPKIKLNKTIFDENNKENKLHLK